MSPRSRPLSDSTGPAHGSGAPPAPPVPPASPPPMAVPPVPLDVALVVFSGEVVVGAPPVPVVVSLVVVDAPPSPPPPALAATVLPHAGSAAHAPSALSTKKANRKPEEAK